MLDSALGLRGTHNIDEAGEAYTTLTLETKFVRAISRDNARVRAEAEVVHRGRRHARTTAEARLTDVETGKLLAHATTTCMVMSA